MHKTHLHNCLFPSHVRYLFFTHNAFILCISSLSYSFISLEFFFLNLSITSWLLFAKVKLHGTNWWLQWQQHTDPFINLCKDTFMRGAFKFNLTGLTELDLVIETLSRRCFQNNFWTFLLNLVSLTPPVRQETVGATVLEQQCWSALRMFTPMRR